MAKKRNLSHNLPMCAQRILPIIQGVFDWNGILFACPYITLEDKKKPLGLSTWTVEFKKGNSLIFKDNEMLVIFAQPINPLSYKKPLWTNPNMDKGLGINNKSKVFMTGNYTISIIGETRKDTLRFVRKLSDKERLMMFPVDSYGSQLRHKIFEYFNGRCNHYVPIDEFLERWDELQKTAI